MVKGISRQVVVVHSPDQKLFEQAFFILKDGVAGVTEDALLREANLVLQADKKCMPRHLFGVLCAAFGAAAVALVWLICALA